MNGHMREFDYIIVGGGLAAASAVDGIREVDVDGSIALLSDESDPPYHRPPLSKEYLQTAEAPRDLLFVKPAGWFDDQPGLEFFAGTRVDRLDARQLVVTTESGVSFHGSRILLATGGRARSLAIPGAGLAGVHTLRTAADAERIRAEARRAERVALVGAGFIGMELASTLKKMEVDSVVLDVTNRVWAGVLPEAVSGFIQRYFEDRGIRFLLGSPVSALEGAGRVARVVLEDGDEIGADMVVIGVGLQPNDQLAAEAGLAVRDGIIVDSHCETTAGHIYAAGDVARFPDSVLGELVRTEHWDHARAHGRTAGRNMAGEREPYDHVSYFFSHVFDLSLSVLGRTAEAEQTIVAGELGSGRSVVYCATEGRLSGTLLINANDAMDACRDLVRERPLIDDLVERLGDEVGSALLTERT